MITWKNIDDWMERQEDRRHMWQGSGKFSMKVKCVTIFQQKLIPGCSGGI